LIYILDTGQKDINEHKKHINYFLIKTFSLKSQ